MSATIFQGPEPPVPEPAPALPIGQLIIDDHNRVRDLFNEYGKTSAPDMKRMLIYSIIREISMHSCKEEQVVYPLIGKLFGADAQMHCLEEHRSLKRKLEQLNNMSVLTQETECDEMMIAIRAEFEQHTMEEEAREVPRLLQSPDVDPIDLGLQFEHAAMHAMTRPHPEAPDIPPANIDMAPMLAEADRREDMVRFGGIEPMVGRPDVTPPVQT